MSGTLTEKIAAFKKNIASSTDATITKKDSNQFINLFAAYFVNMSQIVQEFKKKEKRDFDKIKEAILTLYTINKEIEKSLTKAGFYSNTLNAAGIYSECYEKLSEFRTDILSMSPDIDEPLKQHLLDMNALILQLPDATKMFDISLKKRAIKDDIVPLLMACTSDKLIVELIDACDKQKKDDEEDETEYKIHPDISDETRKRRQQKKFSMRSHADRALYGIHDENKKASSPTTLLEALRDKTHTLFTSFDAKAKYDSSYESEYSAGEVMQNIDDKNEIFADKGLDFVLNRTDNTFQISHAVSPTITINMLKVECKSDAKDTITEVTLTQHSNLNRAKVLVTEELAEIARSMHANFVQISSFKKSDGLVNVDNVIQGTINALYANLLPAFDQKTLKALQDDSSAQATLILTIHSIAADTSDSQRCTKAFREFEAGKDILIDPFKRVREQRTKTI